MKQIIGKKSMKQTGKKKEYLISDDWVGKRDY